jgi:hypothetical protein
MLLVERELDQQESMIPQMNVGMNMAALLQGVVQTNLRAMQELSRVNSPQALLELQRRFALEYVAALQHGTMTLVNALRPTAGPA